MQAVNDTLRPLYESGRMHVLSFGEAKPTKILGKLLPVMVSCMLHAFAYCMCNRSPQDAPHNWSDACSCYMCPCNEMTADKLLQPNGTCLLGCACSRQLGKLTSHGGLQFMLYMSMQSRQLLHTMIIACQVVHVFGS